MARRRKDPYYHRGEPGRWSKILKVLAVILVIGLVLGGTYALSFFQPRKVGWEELGPPSGAVPAEISAMHDKSMELERNFHQAEKIREITAADIEDLRQALRLENDYLAKAHAGQASSDRLVELTETLETYESKPLNDQSIDLAAQAAKLEQTGDIAGARKLYGQAADLEDQIGHDYPHSKYRSAVPAVSAKLHHQVRYLEAMPVHDESLAAESSAETALAHQDWQAALDGFKRSYQLQEKLNHEFPDSSFTSQSRLQSLDAQITVLRALPDYQKILKLLSDAHDADTGKEYAKAAELYQEAERQQRDLMAHYPKSRFASADATSLESIETLRQNALSRPLAMEIAGQATKFFDALRHRSTEHIAETIADLQQKSGNFHATFPHSKLIDEDLQQRIDYLYFKRNELVAIQQQAYEQLLAVPGQSRYLLGKKEVSQSLYQAVAGGNPSRNPGPNLPVDSVNWNEAKDFCRRLSWILDRPVRLPTTEEFTAAVGMTNTLDVGGTTWNEDNSGGKTQPVATKAANANGFYDLLGNVAEWLERPAGYDEDSAPVAGGSAQTPVDAIRTAAPTSLALTARNPFTGFRFVVDTDDSTSLTPGMTLQSEKPTGPATSSPASNLKASSN